MKRAHFKFMADARWEDVRDLIKSLPASQRPKARKLVALVRRAVMLDALSLGPYGLDGLEEFALNLERKSS
jgi:hypothetical protein